jgi:hypothetical protein
MTSEFIGIMRRIPQSMCVVVVGVASAAAAPPGTPASIRKQGDEVEFRLGDVAAARLHAGSSHAKPFLWPLVAPNGAEVTRGWPMEKPKPGGSVDHVHQKSAWFAHGDVIPEGVDFGFKKKGLAGIDFWAEVPIHGRIVCTKLDEPQDHQITATLEWRGPDGPPVLTERRTMALVDLGVGRLLDVICELQADRCAVIFGDTKEGAFGVRVHDQLAHKPAAITNARGGVGEKACWGRLADWCDYSGSIDGKPAGIAVFDDPANRFRACWHVREYGLMAANPFGRAKSGFPDMAGRSDLVRIEKGERLRLRYGLYIHDGDATTGKVAEAFRRFVDMTKHSGMKVPSRKHDGERARNESGGASEGGPFRSSRRAS